MTVMDFKGRSFSFLGRSGSGKDTQLALFVGRKLSGCGTLRLITGDFFRELATKKTIVGGKVKDILEKGGLYPEWLAAYFWEREIIEKLANPETVILLSGSPRRLREAEVMDEVFVWTGRELITPIHIDVSQEEAFRRLKLRARGDDTDGAINARLDWFEKDVQPTLDYYRKQDRLITVDGIGPVDEVYERIRKLLDARI